MMAVEGSKRERVYFTNYLVGVAKRLEGQYTTIDLRNESCITGKIKYVDGFMNIELEDAVFFDQRGFEHTFDTFFIPARLVRYVHIPEHLDAVQLQREMIATIRTSRKTKKVSTFKSRRAKRQHNEIVAGIKTDLHKVETIKNENP